MSFKSFQISNESVLDSHVPFPLFFFLHQIKSLTLALVRTVTLFRPRPEFDMGGSAPDDPSETYVDPDACTTSTSRKKITEEILEMGQRGTKGVVTAKGWWTGVEGGEIVEFSHNMKLPVDALTITRGRHVEVLYSIKVSISSSLSSDVSVELPVRVINFVSLDPPPLKSSSTKVTRNWNRDNHQRNAMSESEAPMIEKMRVMGSPAGLNAGLGLEPTNQSLYLQQPQAALQSTHQTSIDNHLQIPGGDRRLQHQKSLDFINHAIRSATARKTRSNEPSPTGLGIELDENRTPPGSYSSAASSSGSSMVSSVAGPTHPSCAPYEHPYQSATTAAAAPVYQGRRGLYQHPVNLPINMGDHDDDDDDSDDDLGVGNQTLNLNDESINEVDFVIGSARLDGGESSPEFQQRQEFGSDQYLMGKEEEEEGDCSTSTVTSQRGIREEDEYDEEEERLMEQQTRQLQSYSLQAPAINLDDEPTPLAHSPPKFASNNDPLHHGLAALPRTKPSIPRMRASYEDSEDDAYSSSASSRRSVVRTKADDAEPRLGRSSTIIRGPSGDISRPVSPSKQAPSPTKSALKSKSSFTNAPTHEGPFRTSGTTSTKPLTLKAKVSYSQIPKAVPRGVAAIKRPTIVRSSDSESSTSTSPASSVSPLTPESAYSEMTGDGMMSNYGQEQINDMTGLGLNLQPVDVTPKKARTIGNEAATLIPESKSTPTLARSSSVHNLRGSNVVVPSVRDKIAMLESRKQALRDFTGSSSPANNTTGTPTKMTSSGSRNFNNDSTTPTRKQGITLTRQLERNDSYLSDSSSQADYLKHTPSISSFKAPLFSSNQDVPPMPPTKS